MSRNVVEAFFILCSRQQIAFSFDASTVLRWQRGLYIVETLPGRQGGFACRARTNFGAAAFFTLNLEDCELADQISENDGAFTRPLVLLGVCAGGVKFDSAPEGGKIVPTIFVHT